MTGLVLTLWLCASIAAAVWWLWRDATAGRRRLAWARRICPCQKGAK